MSPRLVALVTSVGLLAWSAVPAQAAPQRVPPPPVPPSAPPPTGPGFTWDAFIGPAGELGNRAITTSRAQATTQTITTTGANASTTTTATPSLATGTFGDGVGLLYGADGTWWADERLGLGASLFGAYLGASQNNPILSLNGQDPSTYKNTTSTSGATITGNTLSDSTTITPNVGLAGAYGVVIGIPAAAAQGTLTTSYTGFTVPAGASALTLQVGDTAAGNPKSSVASKGGVTYNYSRTMWLNDLGAHGEYRLWNAPEGALSLFGGVTVPFGNLHQGFTAKTVGDKGQGDTAEQVENAVDATGTATYKRTTDWTVNETFTTDSSFLMAGPVIGLNAQYRLGSRLGLKTQIGYAPVLLGSVTTNGVTSKAYQSAVTISGPTPPAGTQAGTSTTGSSTTTPTQAIGGAVDAETLGSLGVTYDLGRFGLVGAVTVRDYSGTVGDFVYGLQLGLTGTF